jgi:site-specific DNA recombinase
MTSAAIYCRISSDRDEERGGVERQRSDCLNLASRNGWTVVNDGDHDTFTDNDISGAKDADERPAFARLIKAIESGKVDAVIAYKQARIYRDTEKFLAFCRMCKDSGIETVALVSDAAINPNGSLFVATVIAAKDAEERRNTGELVTRKHLERAKDGKYHGGSRVFGWEKDGVTLNATEAELIREAARRILEGESLGSIRADWMERGVKSATGKPSMSTSTIKRILIMPRVAGLRQYQGAILEDVKTEWESILDRTTWEQLVAVLTDPGRRTPRPEVSRRYPLTGVLVCALCGQPLKAMPRTGERSYGCNTKTGGCGHVFLRAQPVENYVRRILVPLADSPAFLEGAFAEEAEEANAAKKLVLENATDEKRLAELSDMLGDGEIDRASYTRQAGRLRDRIAARSSELSTLRGQSALGRFAGRVEASWDTMSVKDQRLILLSLVRSIKVGRAPVKGSNRFDPTRVTFSWRFDVLALASLAIWDAMTDEEKEQAFERDQALLTPEERYGPAQ